MKALQTRLFISLSTDRSHCTETLQWHC